MSVVSESHPGKRPWAMIPAAAFIDNAVDELGSILCEVSDFPLHFTGDLGVGRTGAVRLARDDADGKLVAVKVLGSDFLDDVVNRARSVREVKTMALLRHPNIIHLFHAFPFEARLFIVMEFAERGELFDFIVKYGPLNEEVAGFFFRQAVEAVHHCHKHGVVHRDVKPENLLITRDFTIKLCDFGFCNFLAETVSSSSSSSSGGDSTPQEQQQQQQQQRFFGHHEARSSVSTPCGSPTYAAPEVFRAEPYGYPADIWSLGVNLYVMVTGASPWGQVSVRHQKSRIQRGKYVALPADLDPHCAAMIRAMLVVDPAQRMSLEDALVHPYLLNARTMPEGLRRLGTPDKSAFGHLAGRALVRRPGSTPRRKQRARSENARPTSSGTKRSASGAAAVKRVSGAEGGRAGGDAAGAVANGDAASGSRGAGRLVESAGPASASAVGAVGDGSSATHGSAKRVRPLTPGSSSRPLSPRKNPDAEVVADVTSSAHARPASPLSPNRPPSRGSEGGDSSQGASTVSQRAVVSATRRLVVNNVLGRRRHSHAGELEDGMSSEDEPDMPAGHFSRAMAKPALASVSEEAEDGEESGGEREKKGATETQPSEIPRAAKARSSSEAYEIKVTPHGGNLGGSPGGPADRPSRSGWQEQGRQPQPIVDTAAAEPQRAVTTEGAQAGARAEVDTKWANSPLRSKRDNSLPAKIPEWSGKGREGDRPRRSESPANAAAGGGKDSVWMGIAQSMLGSPGNGGEGEPARPRRRLLNAEHKRRGASDTGLPRTAGRSTSGSPTIAAMQILAAQQGSSSSSSSSSSPAPSSAANASSGSPSQVNGGDRSHTRSPSGRTRRSLNSAHRSRGASEASLPSSMVSLGAHNFSSVSSTSSTGSSSSSGGGSPLATPTSSPMRGPARRLGSDHRRRGSSDTRLRPSLDDPESMHQGVVHQARRQLSSGHRKVGASDTVLVEQHRHVYSSESSPTFGSSGGSGGSGMLPSLNTRFASASRPSAYASDRGVEAYVTPPREAARVRGSLSPLPGSYSISTSQGSSSSAGSTLSPPVVPRRGGSAGGSGAPRRSLSTQDGGAPVMLTNSPVVAEAGDTAISGSLHPVAGGFRSRAMSNLFGDGISDVASDISTSNLSAAMTPTKDKSNFLTVSIPEGVQQPTVTTPTKEARH